MGPAGSLSASDLARVVRTYRDALGDHRATLNRLNVYPVPDGDTGTNMALTVDAVVRELAETEAAWHAHSDLDAVATSLSHGSLMGARGNSGVILSQVLRGMAGAFRDAGSRDGAGASVGPADLADALARASASAYAAVSNPVEGTILSVAKAASQGAARCLEADPGASLAQVLEAAREDVSEALARTTSQLPALRAAGRRGRRGGGPGPPVRQFLARGRGQPDRGTAGPPPPGLVAAPARRALGPRDDPGP